jgi:hypothetical protein
LLIKDRRVNIHANKNEALRTAARRQNRDIVQLLLAYDEVDPLQRSGKSDSLDCAGRGKQGITLDMLLRDRRVSIDDVSDRLHEWLPILRPIMKDRIDGLILASNLSGEVIETDQLMDSIFQGTDSLLKHILIKRPSSEELAEYLSECDDKEMELAIQSVMYNKPIEHPSKTFTGYRGLLLVLIGHDRVRVLSCLRHEVGVTREGMTYAARMIAAHLGAKAFAFSLW